jgi:AcrR family transcriptional regulator
MSREERPIESGDGRQRNPRGQGSRLREEIIDAASRLLERTGRDTSITLRAVAREAGVAAPSIYSHFDSPAEILGAVLSRALIGFATTLRTAAEDIEPARAKLIERSLAYIRFAREQPRRYRFLFERTAPDSIDEVLQPGSDVLAQCELAFGAFIGVVAQAQTEAGLQDAEPATDATLLWAALHGYIVLRTSNPDVPWPDSDNIVVERLINRLCNI